MSSQTRRRKEKVTHSLKDDPNHQTTARADGDVGGVTEISQRDFKPVAARARVVVDLHGLVKRHVLNLDLVVDRDGLVVGVGHGSGAKISARVCVLLNQGIRWPARRML